VTDRHVAFLRADHVHTVRSLTGRLLEMARGGLGDTGFPVLVRDTGGKEPERKQKGPLRVVGYLGINELEHALCE
jgi:chloride channel 3/4/5